MKIAIGSDHGGFFAKAAVIAHLKSRGYDVVDFGTDSLQSCHYPTYALKVAEAVKDKVADRGVVICTTGEGVCVAANKVRGIRCGLAYNADTARLIVEHNNCSVVAFGAKFFDNERIIEMLDIFLKTEFAGDRHQNRIDIITEYEEQHSK